MDSIRSIFGVGVAHLMVLSTMVPAFADVSDDDADHRRLHGRRHTLTVSHSREDYPIVTNWLTLPDGPDMTQANAESTGR